MAVIKCKMCGGDLELIEGRSVAECEYCGSRQTVPAADNEKKLSLFTRANRLRQSCEFDKAAGIYESIVADFPEEAEAYWGLVLCKYGIEYVDDPGTGKKIPTCHRSSFDSVLKDSNFELFQEYADAVARKVCREEAKQIEEIRKGILAVSASEEPYDIFICYKETGFDGKRTQDSVFAQEIYETLTDKGYRVFFAKITLEDKLGQAYEPFIFAALNSAKIMLVMGTDFEYFNAVWVKNEWSRFLKLMARDKDKYLIPCYKGIDAYDMPEEFSNLQGQDMDKIGWKQDLMRGIGKILPREQKPVVVQERVVVGSTTGNKIASLLDRGNMALEDGDWAKADSFFEDVLNNDSKNAEGYLGKTLAQEKCRTLDAFIRKRQDANRSVRGETKYIQRQEQHIWEITGSCVLPGYLEEKKVQALYDFDRGYHSNVAERKKQVREEENYWATHKTLSRAVKFAQGEFAAVLQKEKKRLFDALAQQVKQAEEAENAAAADLQARYDAHIAQADEQARKLHEEACAYREAEYNNNLTTAKNTEDPMILFSCGKFFRSLNGFRDSEALAEHCTKRTTEIQRERRLAEEKAARERRLREEEEQRRLAEEEERRIIAQRKAEREAAAKRRKITIISLAALAAMIALIVLTVTVFMPNSKLSKAQSLMDSGEYQQAWEVLDDLGDYKNSDELLAEIAKHGAYLPSSWEILKSTSSYHKFQESPAVLTFQYNEKGHPVKISRTYTEGGTPAESEIRYKYYESGRISELSAYTNGALKYEVTFYDNELNRVEFANIKTLGFDPCSFWEFNGFRFYGLKSRTYYGSKEPTTYRYTEDGASDAYTVETGEDGSIIHISKESGTRYVYNFNKDGTLKERIIDKNGDGVADYSSDTLSFQYSNGGVPNGPVTTMLVNKGTKGYYKDTFTYGDNSLPITHKWWYADGGLKQGGDYIYTWEWVNLDELGVLADAVEAENDAAYAQAEKLLASGDYEGAIAAFEALEEFKDAPDRVMEAKYALAGTLSAAGDYAGAAQLYTALEDYQDSREKALDNGYSAAQGYLESGDKARAAIAFAGLGKYKDAKQLSRELWDEIAVRQTISAGYEFTVALKKDGTVLAVGANGSKQCNVSSWPKNLIAISAGGWHTMGLKDDGTVVAVGAKNNHQLDVSEWSDIVAIAAGARHSLGLKADGTVVAAGQQAYGQDEVGGWTEIIAIAGGEKHSVGLRVDGTVVAVGDNDCGQCEVSSWTDIVAISAGAYHTVGLKADGTVVVTSYKGSSNNYYGQCELDGWTDIVAISAGWCHTLGLKADGTVVANRYTSSRKYNYGQVNVSNLNNIVSISAGGFHTLVLNADGTVAAMGKNEEGQCRVSSMKNIKLPQ